MPNITIIMPVYNAQTTLMRAVESILAQTMTDFELIIIDDGSQDNSYDIAMNIADGNERVKVYHQQNKGICAARNAGLCLAKGEYITFCDDDDVLTPGALAAAWQTAQQTNADVVRTGYRLLRQNQNGDFFDLPHPAGQAVTFIKGTSGNYALLLNESGPQFVWNSMYRRVKLDEIYFDECCKMGLEDFIFNANVYRAVSSVVYNPYTAYVHYETVQSTSSAVKVEAVLARINNIALWVQAEYGAAVSCCEKKELRSVWNDRKTEFITFLMHQLRDSAAPREVRRAAWKTLRMALHRYPHPSLDICALKGHNIKQIVVLILYTLHLQGIYRYLPNREV